MSPPLRKLKLDFLLNKESEQPGDADKSERRASRHDPGSSSNASHGEGSSFHKRDRPSKHSSTGQPSSSGHVSSPSHSASTPAGSSSAHRSMQQERSYRCDTCFKTFAEKGNLNKHISSVHLKEKNKVCPEPGCGKSFAFRDGLVRHITHVHKNQRRHVCQLCGNSFKQGSHLTKHMKSIHKIQ